MENQQLPEVIEFGSFRSDTALLSLNYYIKFYGKVSFEKPAATRAWADIPSDIVNRTITIILMY